MSHMLFKIRQQRKKFKSKRMIAKTITQSARLSTSLFAVAAVAAAVCIETQQAHAQPFGSANAPTPLITYQTNSGFSAALGGALKPVIITTLPQQQNGGNDQLLIKIPAPMGLTSPLTNLNSISVFNYILSTLEEAFLSQAKVNKIPLPISIQNDQWGNWSGGETGNTNQPPSPDTSMSLAPAGPSLNDPAGSSAAAPGPLPVLGLATAFGCSRRLRGRINKLDRG